MQLNPDNDPPQPYDVNSVGSVVLYGTSPDNLSHKIVGTNDGKTSKRLTYQYIYNAASGSINGRGTIYDSPILHHVLLQNLQPGQRYFYSVGSDEWGYSDVFNFTMPANRYPFTVGVIGDPGQTQNSSETFDRMAAGRYDAGVILGDLSYADTWLPNGTYRGSSTVRGSGGDFWVSDQTKWDTWGRLVQPLMASTPFVTIAGNHEQEIQWQRHNLSFLSYNSRYPGPQDPSSIDRSTSPIQANVFWNSTYFPNICQWNDRPLVDSIPSNNSYYSIDIGPAHFAFISSYVPYSNHSVQYKWFMDDMRKVDRKSTPWVIVGIHASMYHSYEDNYKSNAEMLQFWEPALRLFKVDLVLQAHVHSYERTVPVYKDQPDSCGPVYITVGDGGNDEGPDAVFIDQVAQTINGTNTTAPAPVCYNPWELYVPGSHQATYSGVGYINPNIPFCYSVQPPWSDYRDPSFGHGALTFLNATHAQWRWNRNLDPVGQYNDDVIIGKKDPGQACSKYVVGGTALAANAANANQIVPMPPAPTPAWPV